MDIKDRLLSKKNIDSNECWNYTGSLRRGYGIIKYNKKNTSVHRLSWEVFIGKIPDGLIVCHKCDNRKCFNPDHLFIGTFKDNMQDCKNKGRLVVPQSLSTRFKKGDYSKNTPVKIEDAIKIKKAVLNRNGKSLKTISEEWGVKYQYVRDISRGRILNNIDC